MAFNPESLLNVFKGPDVYMKNNILKTKHGDKT